MKIFTFSMGASPAELEVLSTNTLFDLVDIGLDVCNPRPEETAEDHLWNITKFPTGKRGVPKKYVYGPYEAYTYGDMDKCKDATTTTLAELSLKKGSTLFLQYDLGRTTIHKFTVLSTKTLKDLNNIGAFPRRKPERLLRTQPFWTNEVDLDEEYPALSHWTSEWEGSTEINLFQAGRKHNYGFLENENVAEAHLIFLADKPQTLNHYMDCLNVGAGVRKKDDYEWHSVVVLPAGSKKFDKYCHDELEKGFIDCRVVANNEDDCVPDLATVFPKVAALHGWISKGQGGQERLDSIQR